MKRIVAFALSFVFAVCIMGSTKTYAAGCNHNFDWGFDSDICQNCGAIRSGINAPFELPFIIREDTVVARKAPRQSSAVVKTYKKGTRIKVVARIRNESNNMWLKLSDGSYMFADRAAFDYDSMASIALNNVYLSSYPVVCLPNFNSRNGPTVHCYSSISGTLFSMLGHFRPNGIFDLKQRNLLGLKYDYYVYANGAFLNKRYTGENLGNILYGYTCRKVGISLNSAIRFAGLAESSSATDTVACFFLNDLPRCDNKDDIDMIKLGWNGFSYNGGCR